MTDPVAEAVPLIEPVVLPVVEPVVLPVVLPLVPVVPLVPVEDPAVPIACCRMSLMASTCCCTVSVVEPPAVIEPVVLPVVVPAVEPVVLLPVVEPVVPVVEPVVPAIEPAVDPLLPAVEPDVFADDTPPVGSGAPAARPNSINCWRKADSLFRMAEGTSAEAALALLPELVDPVLPAVPVVVPAAAPVASSVVAGPMRLYTFCMTVW
ncbi:MAG: hypothetical protein EHM24_25205 [Acidobacteria bacterium]|nr:MAG: hypothetical protein EHM24_25205 [Acidobacteriota bacterium]